MTVFNRHIMEVKNMKVLLLSVPTGYGHHQTAASIMSCFTEMGIPSHMVDVCEYINPKLATSVSKTYLMSTKYVPKTYGKIYRKTETKDPGDYMQMMNIVGRLTTKKIARYINEYAPDVIICTHVFTAQIITAMRKNKIIDTPAIGIVTDFVTHPFWEDTVIEYYVTPSALLNNQMKKKGISDDKILPFGIPIHAAEFWMIEPEMAFCDLAGDMRVAEDMIKYVVSYCLENAPEEMNFFNNFVEKGLMERLNNLVNSDFGQVTYTEAVDILKEHNDEFQYKVFWGCDLQTEHERYLTEKIFKKPVFVTDYPKEIKAFYMRMNDDNKTVAAMDLLTPGIGEIIGGSQREERLDILTARMAELGLDEKDYWWYLDLRRFGGCKHAGYGLGFERLIMYLTGISNIRDVIPYPRTVKNAEF